MKRFKKLSIEWGRLVTTLVMVPLATALVVSQSSAQSQGFRVVVHATNPVSSMSAGEVARIFQKRVTRWDNGQTMLPVDLPEATSARVQFTQVVHGKSVSAIRAHWQRQIFSGRGVPPVEKASEGEVLSFVGANVNAIGYISPGARVQANVKVLQIS